MANPQRENGHIDIANEIAEALMRINLSAYESRVLWLIFRKTYGWNKKTDWLTLSQFSKSIGLDRRLIHRAIKHLSSKKMIVINRDDNNRISYGFQKNYRKWKVSSKKMITVINRDDEVSSKEMIRVSSIEIPTNTTITNTTITKEKEREKQNKKISPSFNFIVDKWNEKLEPKIELLSDGRKNKLRVRIKEKKFIDNYEKILEIIKTTPFLQGSNERGWIADFDWLIANDTNYLKVLEGKYKNKSKGGLL